MELHLVIWSLRKEKIVKIVKEEEKEEIFLRRIYQLQWPVAEFLESLCSS